MIWERVLNFVRRHKFAIILIVNLIVFAIYFIPNYENKIELNPKTKMIKQLNVNPKLTYLSLILP